MIGLESYSKIKNNYCLCYFGNNDEYLMLLEYLRPNIERTFPGMNFYIGCKDESLSCFEKMDKILPISMLKIEKDKFAHIKELKFDGKVHPIEELMESSGIDYLNVEVKQKDISDSANIITHGSFPTGPMSQKQVDLAKKIISERGMSYEINGSKLYGLTIGVESINLIKSLRYGSETFLVNTGVGKNLLKKMFSNLKENVFEA